MKNSTMNKISIAAFIIGLLFSLLSCTKEGVQRNAAEPEPTGSKIEFSLYNSTKTYVQVNASSQVVAGTKVYSFVGTKNPVAENIFSITFMTDSLRPGTYSSNTGVVNFREGNTVVTNSGLNDALTITITSNDKGLINGRFSGTLTNNSTSSNCAIVQGVIENIQLVYR